MDRITQCQDAIDQLITIMFSSIAYITKKAGFKQLSDDIPITAELEDAQSAQTFAANRKELADDLIKKAKQIELIISSLPDPPNPALFDQEYAALDEEEAQVDAAYLEAYKEAEIVYQDLKSTIDQLIDEKVARDAIP